MPLDTRARPFRGTPACSPLTRSALRQMVQFKPGSFVAVVGAVNPGIVTAASTAVGSSGRVMLVPGSDEDCGGHAMDMSNSEIVRGSPSAIQLPNFVADLVISCCAIHRERDVTRAYEEVHRVLRLGGRFVMSDLVSARTDRVVPIPAGVVCAACGSPLMTEAAYLGAVSSAGFASVEILQRTAPYDLGGLRVSSIVLTSTRTCI